MTRSLPLPIWWLYYAAVSQEPETKIWTRQRRLMGNLIPFLFWLPPTAYGFVQILQKQDYLGEGLWWMLAGLFCGWLGVNFSGVQVNRHMETELRKRLEFRRENLGAQRWFVGFASPKFAGVLDAHEDVGFLVLDQDEIRFVSDTRKIRVRRDDVERVRFRPNVHTMLGMGGWISIEGHSADVPFRLLIEPRVHGQMLLNFSMSRSLRKKLTEFVRTKPMRANVPKRT